MRREDAEDMEIAMRRLATPARRVSLEELEREMARRDRLADALKHRGELELDLDQEMLRRLRRDG
jgi:hypothetical protein